MLFSDSVNEKGDRGIQARCVQVLRWEAMGGKEEKEWCKALCQEDEE